LLTKGKKKKRANGRCTWPFRLGQKEGKKSTEWVHHQRGGERKRKSCCQGKGKGQQSRPLALGGKKPLDLRGMNRPVCLGAALGKKKGKSASGTELAEEMKKTEEGKKEEEKDRPAGEGYLRALASRGSSSPLVSSSRERGHRDNRQGKKGENLKLEKTGKELGPAVRKEDGDH